MNLVRLMSKLRLFCLYRLGGVDRVAAQKFACDYLQPNGRSKITVCDDGAEFIGETFHCLPDSPYPHIAIAPWAAGTSIIGCTFLIEGSRA